MIDPIQNQREKCITHNYLLQYFQRATAVVHTQHTKSSYKAHRFM